MTPQEEATALRAAFTVVTCFAIALVIALVGAVWVLAR